MPSIRHPLFRRPVLAGSLLFSGTLLAAGWMWNHPGIGPRPSIAAAEEIDPVEGIPYPSSPVLPGAHPVNPSVDWGQTPSDAPKEIEIPGRKGIRLCYLSAPWPKVLRDVAEATGTTLVMHAIPPGRYNRIDKLRYSRIEVLRMLNRELEPQGFRILEKDNFLIVISLKSLRTEYNRPIVPGRLETGADCPPGMEPLPPAKPVSAPTRSTRTITGRGHEAEGQPGEPGRPGIVQVSGTNEGLISDPKYAESTRAVLAVPVAKASATEIARQIHRTLAPQSELIDEGPRGLPAFRVYGSARMKQLSQANAERATVPASATKGEQQPAPYSLPTLFVMGIDVAKNELVIEATAGRRDALVELIKRLDVEPKADTKPLLLASASSVGVIAAQTVPLLANFQVEAPRPGLQPSGAAGQRPAPGPNFPNRGENSPRPMGRQNDPGRGGAGAAQPGRTVVVPQGMEGDLPSLLSNVRGDVSIEALNDLGLLVLRGNEKDVELVLQIIQEIEKRSKGAVPEIHLLVLRHVNSAAIAELLNAVYERLTTARTRGTAPRTQTVSIIPVAKPNSLLIIAPETDMKAILKLAEELDQPIDPSNEFEVFRLEHAVSSQAATLVENFFRDRPATGTAGAATPGTTPGSTGAGGGLASRVSVLSDPRTNSLIVQARPRDMKEVSALIRKIDRDSAKSVSTLRIFPLKNAVADELANLMNLSIQSVLNPAQLTGQGGQGVAGLAAAAGGTQASQQLREVKSVVLEFLTADGQANRLVRSGLLTDIRINSDIRSNALLITAPIQSMPLLEALVRQLDKPSTTVADIKVFTLANTDATQAATLLQTLFAQRTQQGAGGPGGAAGQANQIGIQIAGAEDASSMLIPLRFSVDPRTNSIIAVGGAEALRIVDAILLTLDATDARQRKTEVIKLLNVPVTEVGNAINQFLQSQRQITQLDPNQFSGVELVEREIIAVPEPVSNSLLISATPKYFDDIRRMIAKLDQAPRQVIIQALLVEVELTNNDELGVELGFQDKSLFDRGAISDLQTITQTVTSPNGVQTTSQQIISQTLTPGFAFNNNPLGNNAAGNPSKVGTQGLSNFSLGRANSELGFGGLVLSASSQSVSVLIRALAARRNVHILSRPQIRTLDNQLAQIQVGQQVPIVDGVNVTGVGNANPLIRQDNAGIILTVTPRIAPDGVIVMETVAEKSAFNGQGVPIFTDAATGNVINSPIKDLTTARTTVSVPNGQTIVLGGMITKLDETIERKVPCLGDIPFLGAAFRYDARTTRRTELLIFLTPRVIENDGDSELIKQVEAERLNFMEKEAENVHGPLFSTTPPTMGFTPFGGDAGPILPDGATPLFTPGMEFQDVPTTIMPGQPTPVLPAPGMYGPDLPVPGTVSPGPAVPGTTVPGTKMPGGVIPIPAPGIPASKPREPGPAPMGTAPGAVPMGTVPPAVKPGDVPAAKPMPTTENRQPEGAGRASLGRTAEYSPASGSPQPNSSTLNNYFRPTGSDGN